MDTSFASLRTEHIEIARELQNAIRLFAQGEPHSGLESLQNLGHLLQEHYQHEDELLFSQVFAKPKLSEGGPFCTLYFDSFLHHRPFEKLQTLMRKVNPQFVLPMSSLSEQRYILEKSPLAIPSEEHLAIFILVKELISFLSESAELNPAWRGEAMSQLAAWVRANHEKEENCLFALCGNLLKNKKCI